MGLESVLSAFEMAPEKMESLLTRGLLNAASVLVETIQSTISQSFPPPSEPEQAPHLRTGALRRSVRVEDVQPLKVTVAIGGPGSLVPYAGWLELGTSKMEPRPFVTPTTKDLERLLPDLITEQINRELESIAKP